MYCSITDLTRLLPETELVQLAGDADGADLADPAVVANLTEAIDQADREIDAYCGLAVPVPLDPAPGLIADLAAKMAVYHLYLRRSVVPAEWKSAYERCLKVLEKIADGRMTLGPDPGDTAEPESRIRADHPDREFTRDLLEDF